MQSVKILFIVTVILIILAAIALVARAQGGEPINTGSNEQCPMISPDGKHLFFISHRSQTSDIYWVDAKVLKGI